MMIIIGIDGDGEDFVVYGEFVVGESSAEGEEGRLVEGAREHVAAGGGDEETARELRSLQ